MQTIHKEIEQVCFLSIPGYEINPVELTFVQSICTLAYMRVGSWQWQYAIVHSP
jgi:hypothetical protein